MKQLLFLLIFPCLAWAQYPSNGNQKITLGEQTTADGLFYRGLAADTTRKPSVDTMAYMLLDTTTNIMWHYKKATNNAWLRLNLLPSDTASMLTNYYLSGRTGIIQASDVPTLNQSTTGSAATLTTSRTFQTNLASTSTASFNGSANVTPGVTGTLPVANGGTGSTTQNFVDLTNTQTVGGAKTFSSTVTATRFDPTSSSPSGNGLFLPSTNIIGFSTNGTEKMRIASNGRVGIGTSTLTGILNIKESGSELSIASDANNVYFEGINRDNTASNVDYGFYARNGAHKFWTGVYTERMRLTNDGELWLGYTTDQGASLLQVNGSINAAGTTYTSDERYKENIIPLNKGLDIINKLKPVTFNYINTTANNFSEFEEIGFIAQDVDRALSTESFVKSIVKYSDESNIDSKMVFSPQNLIPLLVKAIQEQNSLIKALEQRIINLENK